MAQNTHPDNCNCVEVHSWYGEGHASACPCHPENHNATHPLQEAVIMLGGAAFESASKAFSRAVQRLGVSS